MITIYKYPLDIKDEQQIEVPYEHKVLHVGFDGNQKLCVWIQVNTNSYLVHLTFYVIGTGNPMPIDTIVDYIGSVHDNITNPNITFIWHIFKHFTN